MIRCPFHALQHGAQPQGSRFPGSFFLPFLEGIRRSSSISWLWAPSSAWLPRAVRLVRWRSREGRAKETCSRRRKAGGRWDGWKERRENCREIAADPATRVRPCPASVASQRLRAFPGPPPAATPVRQRPFMVRRQSVPARSSVPRMPLELHGSQTPHGSAPVARAQPGQTQIS